MSKTYAVERTGYGWVLVELTGNRMIKIYQSEKMALRHLNKLVAGRKK